MRYMAGRFGVAGGQLVGFGSKARRDEAGREGRLQHADLDRIEQR